MANLKLVSKSSADGCARALRAIGQDLGSLFPENLQIEVAGNAYIVRGKARINSAQVKRPVRMTALKKFFKRVVRKISTNSHGVRKSEPVFFDRTYKPADIDRIYGVQMADRARVGRNPDPHSLGEQLRMVGRIVQLRHGKLIKLSTNKNSVTIEYSEPNGAIRTEEISGFALYRLQQQYSSQRKSNQRKDAWDEIEPSRSRK